MKTIAAISFAAFGLVLAADVWRFGALADMAPSLGRSFKLAGFVIAGSLLLWQGWLFTRTTRPLRGQLLLASAGPAIGGALEAYLGNLRIQGGQACNQCHPALLLFFPILYAIAGALAAVPFIRFRQWRGPPPQAG